MVKGKSRVQGSGFSVQGTRSVLPSPMSSRTTNDSPPRNADDRRPNASRIGLFGGAFNPIHLGHLRAGLEIREAFALDRVLFIPTAFPPHKEVQSLLPFRLRLHMVRLALSGCPFFQASDFEGHQRGTSYSIRTLRHFKKTLGPETELYFILGMDAFLEIHTWKAYPLLFSLCHFVVMERPGFRNRSLKTYVRDRLSPDFVYVPKERRFQHPGGFSVFLFPVTHLDISSTRIRRLREEGRSVRFLLPEKVEQYILENRLYAP